MNAQQLFEALKDGLDSGAIDPTDNICLIRPAGHLVPFYPFDENRVRSVDSQAFELRADGFVLATTEK